EPRRLEIPGDDLRARRQARLHPGLDGEAARGGLPGQDARAEHDARVGRVRAAGDRRDHDRAVAKLAALPAHLDRLHAPELANPLRRGGDRRERLAALPAPDPELLRIDRRGTVLLELAERVAPSAARAAERHPILRPARPREARLDGPEVELEPVAELRLGTAVGAEGALRPGLGLD